MILEILSILWNISSTWKRSFLIFLCRCTWKMAHEYQFCVSVMKIYANWLIELNDAIPMSEIDVKRLFTLITFNSVASQSYDSDRTQWIWKQLFYSIPFFHREHLITTCTSTIPVTTFTLHYITTLLSLVLTSWVDSKILIICC